MEKNLTLKLHLDGEIANWNAWRRLVCLHAGPVQLTDSFTEKSFCFWWQHLITPSLCLLSILVGGQFDCPLQEVFPVNSLNYCCCHLFLFPAQSAADWLIWHLQVKIIICDFSLINYSPEWATEWPLPTLRDEWLKYHREKKQNKWICQSLSHHQQCLAKFSFLKLSWKINQEDFTLHV